MAGAVGVHAVDGAVGVVVDAVATNLLAGVVARAVVVGAVGVAVLVVVDPVVADFGLRCAGVVPLAVGVVAVHVAVVVVVDPVVAGLDRTLHGAHAGQVGAVHRTVAVVVDAVVADLIDVHAGAVALIGAAAPRDRCDEQKERSGESPRIRQRAGPSRIGHRCSLRAEDCTDCV